MNDALKLEGAALCCDNKDCNYEDETLYSVEEMKTKIDSPCPKCGSNLLTEKDYKDFVDEVEMYIALISSLNQFLPKVDPNSPTANTTRISIKR